MFQSISNIDFEELELGKTTQLSKHNVKLEKGEIKKKRFEKRWKLSLFENEDVNPCISLLLYSNTLSKGR